MYPQFDLIHLLYQKKLKTLRHQLVSMSVFVNVFLEENYVNLACSIIWLRLWVVFLHLQGIHVYQFSGR